MQRISNAIVPLAELTRSELEQLQDDLTLPNPNYFNLQRFSKYGKVPTTIPKELYFYTIDQGNIIIPRNYYEPTDFVTKTLEGTFADIKFLQTLRGYQDTFFKGVDYAEDDLIFQVPCGHGKTTMSLYLASVFKRKTLVLVPTNYLVEQWIKRIKTFTGEQPLLIKSTLNNLELNNFFNYNIYIITFDMFNSIYSNINNKWSKPLGELLNKHIGFTIVDELHKTGAESYHPIISYIPAKRRLGLTATLRRQDGREKILQFHFGKSYKLPNQFPNANFYPIATGIKIDRLVPLKNLQPDIEHVLELLGIDFDITHDIRTVKDKKTKQEKTTDEGYLHFIGTPLALKLIKDNKKNLLDRKSIYWLNQPAQVTQIDNYAMTNGRCIKIYQSIIRKCLREGRTVLVLSNRKKILKTLYSAFKDEYVTSLIISETNNQTPEEVYKLENESQLMLGINQIAEYGLDIDRIDTLIPLRPSSDTEQAIGRIIRYVKNKKQPLVFQPLHENPAYFGLFQKSRKFVQLNANLKKAITISDLKTVLHDENTSPY